MSGPAYTGLITVFLDEFYDSLLIRKNDFETAVYHGRDKLRHDHSPWPSDFVCVQYLRGPPPILAPQKLPLRPFDRALAWLRDMKRRPLRSFYQRLSKDPMEQLITTSDQSSARGSHSRVPRSSNLGFVPELIRLQLLFLKLEVSLMQHGLVWAYDARYKNQFSLLAVETQMKNLAYIWVKTGFLGSMKVYRAEDFKSNDLPEPVFTHPKKRTRETMEPGCKRICIFENADVVFAGQNQPEEEGNNAAKNLDTFFGRLNWNCTSVVILTGQSRDWCKRQKWTEKAKGWDYWSYQQDDPQGDPLRKTLYIPSPTSFRARLR
jgi:hypothetical protein